MNQTDLLIGRDLIAVVSPTFIRPRQHSSSRLTNDRSHFGWSIRIQL